MINLEMEISNRYSYQTSAQTPLLPVSLFSHLLTTASL